MDCYTQDENAKHLEDGYSRLRARGLMPTLTARNPALAKALAEAGEAKADPVVAPASAKGADERVEATPKILARSTTHASDASSADPSSGSTDSLYTTPKDFPWPVLTPSARESFPAMPQGDSLSPSRLLASPTHKPKAAESVPKMAKAANPPPFKTSAVPAFSPKAAKAVPTKPKAANPALKAASASMSPFTGTGARSTAQAKPSWVDWGDLALAKEMQSDFNDKGASSRKKGISREGISKSPARPLHSFRSTTFVSFPLKSQNTQPRSLKFPDYDFGPGADKANNPQHFAQANKPSQSAKTENIPPHLRATMAAKAGQALEARAATTASEGDVTNTAATDPNTVKINAYEPSEAPSVVTASATDGSSTNTNVELRKLTKQVKELTAQIEGLRFEDVDNKARIIELETWVEKYTFLGTVNLKAPFAVNVKYPDGTTEKIQTFASMPVGAFLERIMSKKKMRPDLVQFPTLTYLGERVPHLMMVGQVRMLEDSDVVFGFEEGED